MVKPGYKQTEVGVVPKEWSVMTLRDIADFWGGGTPSKSIAEYWNGDIPWISSSDISLNSVHGLNITRYITGQAVKESSTQLCPRNAILIVTRVGVGKIAIAPTNICTSQDFTNIVLRQDNVEYVARALQPVFYCMSNETQGTSIKGVTTDEVKNTSIALPPIKEQEQIATVLSEIDELISLTEKQISKKKAIKQGAMQELLTGKRRLPGFSGEWETRTLHEISNEMVDGPFGSNLKTEHYTTERQVRIIQLSNIGEAGWNNANVKYTTFSHAAELQRCIVQPGSILIAKMMPAGRAIICPDNEKSYILGSDVVKVVPNSSVDSRYLVYATKSRFYLDQIADDTQGSTRARTSVSKLRKTAILFPEKDEQIAIADILSEMDMEIAALEGKIAKYRQIKQGMMQQLLTGKIRLV